MDDIILQDTPRKQCTGPCQRMLPATPEYFDRRGNGLKPRCKACRKVERKIYNDTHTEENKRYAQEHKEEARIRNRRFTERHQEAERTRKKLYGEMHREQERIRGRRYYAEHREQERARSKRYGKTHRETEQTRQRRYYRTHLEKERARGRIHAQRRRVHLMRIKGTLTTQHIQFKLKAQKYRCYYCHNKFEQHKDKTYIYHLEHTVPISRSDYIPRHDVNYVVLACPTCNLKKRNRLPHEWYEGSRLL